MKPCLRTNNESVSGSGRTLHSDVSQDELI